jgi:hypothetical protein
MEPAMKVDKRFTFNSMVTTSRDQVLQKGYNLFLKKS